MTEKCFNYTDRYLKFQLGRLKTCTVFSAIFSLLGFPLLALSQYCNDLEEFSVLAVLAIIALCIMSYVAPIFAFSHLYDKTSADNILSLPLTGNQRFSADILSAHIAYAAPYAVSCLLTLVAELVFNDSLSFDFSIIAFKGLFLLLSFSALNCFLLTLCGRKTEAAIYPIVINAAATLIPVFCGMTALVKSPTVLSFTEEILRSPIVMLTPFGNAVNFIITGEEMLSLFESGSIKFYLYALASILISVLLAFIFYKKRNAENIGKPFVFKGVFTAISMLAPSTIIFLVFFFIHSEFDYLDSDELGTYVVTVMIIVFVMMLIMQAINFKKISHFFRFLGKYAITLGASAFICALCVLSKGFYAPYTIPSASAVESVRIDARSRDFGNECVHAYDIDDIAANNRESYFNIKITGKDDIKAVTDFHKELLDYIDYTSKTAKTTSLHDAPAKISYITLRYGYKNGEELSREYALEYGSPLYSEVLKFIYGTDDYRLSEFRNIEYDSYIGDEDLIKTIRLVNTENSDKIYFEQDLSHEEYLKLYEALEKDLLNDENAGRHADAPMFELMFGYYSKNVAKAWGQEMAYITDEADGYKRVYPSITIYEGYTETLNILKSYGELPTPEQNNEDAAKNCEVFMLIRSNKSLLPDGTPLSDNNLSTRGAVFITAEEYKALSQKRVDYNIADGSEYNYSVIRGIRSDIHYGGIYSTSDYISALADIGVQVDFSLFFDNGIFNLDNSNKLLHEDSNAMCEELFETREIFIPSYDIQESAGIEEYYDKEVYAEEVYVG